MSERVPHGPTSPKSTTSRTVHTIPPPRRPGRYASTRYRWVDVVTISYMAATGTLHLLLAHDQPGMFSQVLLHFAYVAFGLEVVRASQRRPESRLLLELVTWYPAVIILYGFFDVTRLQSLISDGTFWATDLMVEADRAIFGLHPTVWFEKWHRPWLDELFCFFNVSYYIIPFLFAVPLWLAGRRRELWAGTSIVLFVYVINYTLFLLLPAVGPRMVPTIEALRHNRLHDGPFVWLHYVFQGKQGAVRGAAFPSAHVSAAVAWSMAAWRYERRIAWILWPLAIGTAVSTIYLGYHHAIDPIAGLVLGVAGYWAGLRILRGRGEDPPVASRRTDAKEGGRVGSERAGRSELQLGQ